MSCIAVKNRDEILLSCVGFSSVDSEKVMVSNSQRLVPTYDGTGSMQLLHSPFAMGLRHVFQSVRASISDVITY